MKRITYILLLTLLFFSCKKKEENYYITVKGQPFEIEGARVLRNENFPSTNIRDIHLYFYTNGISFNVDQSKGNGGVLCLQLRIENATDIKEGNYEISDNIANLTIAPGKKDDDNNISGSYFKYTKSTKVAKDTTYTLVKRGWISISSPDEKEQNTFTIRLVDERGDSISGEYVGTHTIINNMDGVAVGEVIIGDSIYSLQKGDLMRWGDIWSCGANYYELFFYSCNMRTTENGAFSKGLVMVIGIGSKGANLPNEQTYALSKGIKDGVAWTGRKENGIDWGSYWYNYLSTSTHEKANINKGNLTLAKDGNAYNITFDCQDQLGNPVTGYYQSDFNIIDLREK